MVLTGKLKQERNPRLIIIGGTKLYQAAFPVNIGCHFYRILQVFDIKPDFIGIAGFFLATYRKILSLSCLFHLHFGQVLSQGISEGHESQDIRGSERDGFLEKVIRGQGKYLTVIDILKQIQ